MKKKIIPYADELLIIKIPVPLFVLNSSFQNMKEAIITFRETHLQVTKK